MLERLILWVIVALPFFFIFLLLWNFPDGTEKKP